MEIRKENAALTKKTTNMNRMEAIIIKFRSLQKKKKWIV